jgi:hypothetical protein
MDVRDGAGSLFAVSSSLALPTTASLAYGGEFINRVAAAAAGLGRDVERAHDAAVAR